MHMSILLLSFFLFGFSSVDSAVIKNLNDLVRENCIFAQQANYYIYVCKDSVTISDAKVSDRNHTFEFKGELRNMRIVPKFTNDHSNLIYIYRETDLLEINMNNDFSNATTLYSIYSLKEYDLDLKSDIIASEEFILFKKKKYCNVQIFKFKEEIKQPPRSIFEIEGSKDDCKIQFAAHTQDDKIYVDIYLKETSNLVTVTTNYISSERVRDMFINPTIFQIQYDQYKLESYNHKLMFFTKNSIEDLECVYILSSKILQLHLDYYICDRIVEAIYKEQNIFLSTLDKSLKITRLHYYFDEAPPDKLVTEINYQEMMPNERILLQSCKVTSNSEAELSLEYCFASNYDSTKSIYCKSEKINKKTSCESFRSKNGYDDIFNSRSTKCLNRMLGKEILSACPGCKNLDNKECKSCIMTSDYNCISFKADQYCKDESISKIMPNECGLEIKKINEKFQISMVLRQLMNIELRCVFAFDFGTVPYDFHYSFWRSNQSAMISSRANIDILDYNYKTKSRHENIDGLNIRSNYFAINAAVIDYKISFGAEIASQYTVWFITPQITFDSCISCVLYQEKPTIKPNNQVIWNPQAGECVVLSKASEMTDAYSKWYSCFPQDFITMSGGICEIKQDSREKIVISFREKYDYPYCKLRIPIGDRPELSLSFIPENYEDVIIQYNDKFFDMKSYNSMNEGKISDILNVNKISWMSILFLTRNPNLTISTNKEMVLNFESGKNDTVSILGLIVINVVGMVLIMFICFCRSSSDENETISDSPYYIADFATGCPKKIKIKQSKCKDLEKLGFIITAEGNPVSLETSECCICLDLNVEREFRVFLCGRHYVHSDCFQCWFDAQIDNDSKELCPMRCKQILVTPGSKKENNKQKNGEKEAANGQKSEEKKDEKAQEQVEYTEKKQEDTNTEVSESNSPPLESKFDPDATANIFKLSVDSSMFDQTGIVDQSKDQSAFIDIAPTSLDREKTDPQILNTSEWEIDIDMDRDRSLSNIHLLKHAVSSSSTAFPDQKNY